MVADIFNWKDIGACLSDAGEALCGVKRIEYPALDGADDGGRKGGDSSGSGGLIVVALIAVLAIGGIIASQGGKGDGDAGDGGSIYAEQDNIQADDSPA